MDSYYLFATVSDAPSISDLKGQTDLKLEAVPSTDSLGVYLIPELAPRLLTTHQYKSRRRILCRLFPENEGEESVPQSTVTQSGSNYEDLYDLLRERQMSIVRPKHDVQHPLLRPRLREYQKEAVGFMIQRETVPDYIPAQYDKFGSSLFWDAYSGALTIHKPLDLLLPTGGILCDEMGLGKTLEILALILNNPPDFQKGTQHPAQAIHGVQISSPDRLRCICTRSTLKKLIMCTKCEFYQHVKCVTKNRPDTSSETVDNYTCAQCWKAEPPVKSGATIIVSPYSITKQWENEIRKHINLTDKSFRVLMYSGVTRFGWISPLDLAQFDIVITDYNVFKTEIHFTNSNNKEESLRKKKRHMTLSSPLTMIKFWRVCLDEAQMVETPTNQCTKMVKTLTTTHRWAITGTPIEKSIHNLFGLLFFLDCEPYNEFSVWSRLAQPFLDNGDCGPLVDGVLKNIMWRTCKRNVVHQIGIPPQTHECHKIAMSDVQMIFYRDQHQECFNAFLEQAKKMERNQSTAMSTMAKWNPHIIKVLLEPLRKLRQDCTVPSVLTKGDNFGKRLLSPDELYCHLVTTNEIECKTILRTIASSLNGLAGIALLMKNHQLARKYYKSVLQRASENKGSVSVDSLLQIHALHSLIGVLQSEGVDDGEEVKDLQVKLDALESKYTDNYFQVVSSSCVLFSIHTANFFSDVFRRGSIDQRHEAYQHGMSFGTLVALCTHTLGTG